jgi:predicted xylose isomerase-like sugar epimerase
VITLREKKYDSNISVEAVLNAFTKPELKGLVNSLGFNMTSAARKSDFVKCAADIILNRQEIVLSKLSVESLDILANLLHAEEGTFIACPHV